MFNQQKMDSDDLNTVFMQLQWDSSGETLINPFRVNSQYKKIMCDQIVFTK